MPALSLSSRRAADRIPSPRQQRVTANMSFISRSWSVLEESQRLSFVALSQVWSPNNKPASGLTIFQSLNGSLLNSGLSDELLTVAPQKPDFVGKLSAVTLSATRPLALSAGTPNFSLVVHAAPFPGPCVACATRPLSSGVMQPSSRQFVQIALLPDGIPSSGDIDLTTDYLQTFVNAPNAGMKVAVQIVPISPNGFRGTPVTRIVPVA